LLLVIINWFFVGLKLTEQIVIC